MSQTKRLVDEYLDYHRSLVNKYGLQSVVLLQNGSFYEIYNYRQKDGPDLYILADLLNIQVSRRDKSEIEINQSNYEMAGFPIWAKQKFIQLLLNGNYTVAVYNQIEKDRKISRFLDEVISPSTNIDYLNQVDNNYLMSIYIETYAPNSYICGYSLIDLSIGKNYLYESGNHPDDFDYGMDKIYETLKLFNPKEVIIYTDDSLDLINREKVVQHLELDIDNRTVHFYNTLSKEYRRISFQNEFLKKVFPNHGLLDPIEFLDLARYPHAIVSYILLLEFAKSHRVNIIEKISLPELLTETDKLLLTLNSIYQLAVVPDKNLETTKKTNSLLGILNNCSTSIGKRLFKYRLLHPITDISILNQRYDQIDILHKNDQYILIESAIQQILDLERLHRRMQLGTLSPSEFYGLHKSNLSILECQRLLKEKIKCDDLALTDDVYQEFHRYINDYSAIIKLDDIYKYNINTIDHSIFIKGIYNEVDELEDKIRDTENMMEEFVKQISRLIDIRDDLVTLGNNDKEGYFINITDKRYKILESKLIQWRFTYRDHSITYTKENFNFKKGASSGKLYHTSLTKWGHELNGLRQRMCQMCLKYYSELLIQLEQRYNHLFTRIVNFVGHLDVTKTHAKNINLYQLTRPTIKDNDSSFLELKDVRHLIVEQNQKKIPFVTNDIHLSNGHPHNILCYGYNAVGKTTLQKAICLSVIMAQSGGYVAVKQMHFSPFTRLFTRISNVDNLLKGQSSYMVEMLELKYILKHANKRSLVCIDELVASTESYSGISSVVATLKILHDRQTCLFMATHLHQLANMSRVNNLSGLTIKHLEVIYDANNKTLIYDRKLKDGPGSGLYGLEVARFLDLPTEFLNLSFEVRNELLSDAGILEILPHKTSQYNTNIVVDSCQLCGQRQQQLDVHHINFQCHADNKGNFDTFHKNVEHNLVVVCKQCHIDVHNLHIKIDGYVQTSNGVKLQFIKSGEVRDKDEVKETQSKKCKYSDQDKQLMCQALEKINDKMGKKYQVEELFKSSGFKISYQTLNNLRQSMIE